MPSLSTTLGWLQLAVAVSLPTAVQGAPSHGHHGHHKSNPVKRVHLGPRPFWLVDQMDDSPLKKKLESCSEKEMKPTKWSISHRGGGTMQMPEETYESIMAGTRMGAGIQECDVAFTKDLHLVCRHAQCDLHTTTNVVTIPELNAKCTVPFTPASTGPGGTPATAKCCTSDFTLAEIKTLCAKMDASDKTATTPQQFIQGTPPSATDLYAKTVCSEVLTLKEFIAIVDDLGLQFTPELKTPEVAMPFVSPEAGGRNYTQEMYAQQLIDEFKAAGIRPERVWPQSFLYDDILYWLQNEPKWARQAVLLDETADYFGMEKALANMDRYAKDGVRYLAPPVPYLVTLKNLTMATNKIVPSEYAKKAKKLGMNLITWSLERSAWLGDGSHGGYYFNSVADAVNNEGDVYEVLHVLAQDVGVVGVFSDWSATVTYYANCFGLVW